MRDDVRDIVARNVEEVAERMATIDAAMACGEVPHYAAEWLDRDVLEVEVISRWTMPAPHEARHDVHAVLTVGGPTVEVIAADGTPDVVTVAVSYGTAGASREVAAPCVWEFLQGLARQDGGAR